MPAYFIGDLDIYDRTGFAAYAQAVGPILEKFGARYLVAGPGGERIEVLEGDWRPKKLTVIEFPSKERAKEFYRSTEFQKIVGLRHRSARTNLVLVDGA
jgi:uncharacterized protein (DUF1330 family)